eukprot:847000-Amphidinium_carterae.1
MSSSPSSHTVVPWSRSSPEHLTSCWAAGAFLGVDLLKFTLSALVLLMPPATCAHEREIHVQSAG